MRLPKEFRFKAQEVEIFRRGREVILREKPKNLGLVFGILTSFSEDFMSEGRQQPALVTNNEREFLRIPNLKVENWTK